MPTAVKGKDGSARVGSTQISFIDSWTLTPTINTAEITAYGDKTKVNTQTLREFTVEISGTLSTDDTLQGTLLAQLQDDGTDSVQVLRLYTATSAYYVASAVLTGGGITSTVGDKVTVSYSFTSAGPLDTGTT
jgi:hypothetical protein